MIRTTVKFTDNGKRCNCAGCGAEVMGFDSPAKLEWCALSSEYRKDAGPIIIEGHINGRPYCNVCLRPSKKTSAPATKDEYGGPWFENAVRALEEDR